MSRVARRRLTRVAEVALAAPAIGACLVLASTVWAFSGGGDEKVLGAPIVELANQHFTSDVRALTTSLLATAVAVGALVGGVAEVAIALRRARPKTFAGRTSIRLLVVAALYAALLAYGVARMPQLYAPSLWLRPGAAAAYTRTLQLVVTDVLGTTGVVGLTAIGLFVFVAPPLDLRTLRTAGLALGGVALVSGALLLITRRRPPRQRGNGPNVVILAVDSLRDDRLGPHLAPRLASVGASGARFTRAYVTIPGTLPSWTTILTGREPHAHGLRTSFPRYEDRARDLHALPQRLAALGYRSGVVGDHAADSFTRVRYGFDLVDAPTFNVHARIATHALERATPLLPILHSRVGRAVMPAMRASRLAADPALVAADAIRALDRLDDGRPFLLTVVFSAAHSPYAAAAPYHRRFTDPGYRGRFRYHMPNSDGARDEADVRQVRGLYDGAVAAIDAAAGAILDELRRRGLDDGNTIVVVTADHGEMLYDDGRGQGHGDHLFGDQVVHVPLAIRGRGVAPGRALPDVVRDVDLAPTILDLVGAPSSALASFDGRSLRTLLSGGSLPPRPAFAETEVWLSESIAELPSGGDNPLRLPYPNASRLTELDPRLSHDVVMRAECEPIVIAAKHRMIVDGDLKLVYAPTRKGPRWFLFDRARDPRELVDVSARRPDDLERLRGALFRFMLGDRKMEERDGMLHPRASTIAAGEGGSAPGVP